MCTWGNKLLLSSHPLQSARFQQYSLYTWVYLQSDGGAGDFPPQIPLWTQLYWAMLGLRETNLPTKSRVFSGGPTGEKCIRCTRGCATHLNAEVCNSFPQVYGCIWSGTEWPSSSMGSKEVPGTSCASSEHHGRAGEGGCSISGRQ